MQKRKKMGYPVGKIELSCLIKDKEKRPDDWLHASLHDIGNRFTSLEVLELYMSSDATYDPLAPVADQHLVDL
ncbi:hypothetical protein SERLA73DRAFT_182291 [Serpula lacrymans var. lacrymans S7.3]|uniref:Uncharacterized protein n=2 Tax=Serpula lacrymans var. lacrymans TaxID=341189 RepID=F8PX68_SERL3|nr:uncharacterized protein SERLADRAFT_468866 [Serpula lacrymans var. lacrymans S7.9]EGN99343.1 hypothetical protein SERLA73DRAFT_182291 [Serpula lacrymans var. lacrymans S7.3]EGO24907.1 hypothetical protein SERLADRAFT_468866 [Serpula lacrymans var. lacrymans S7.9]